MNTLVKPFGIYPTAFMCVSTIFFWKLQHSLGDRKTHFAFRSFITMQSKESLLWLIRLFVYQALHLFFYILMKMLKITIINDWEGLKTVKNVAIATKSWWSINTFLSMRVCDQRFFLFIFVIRYFVELNYAVAQIHLHYVMCSH